MTSVSNRAFKAYLVRAAFVNPDEAIEHLFDCLRTGSDAAWELLDEAFGRGWSFNPKEDSGKLLQAIAFARNELMAEARGEAEGPLGKLEEEQS